MNRKSTFGAAVALSVCLFNFVTAAFAQDFVPGAEREITRDSEPTSCVNNLRSPACAFETLIYCTIRPDHQVCSGMRRLPEEYCDQEGITKIRYAIEQIYGIDDIDTWAPTLGPLTAAHQQARVINRLKICLRDEPCESPVLVDLGDATKRNGIWEARAEIYNQVCVPPDT